MRSITTNLRTIGASLALLAALACAGGMSLGVVYAERRPPPDRIEVAIGSPGPGYSWIRGYWRWESNDYVWVPGRWERPQGGYHRWVPGRWTQRHNRWYWSEGHWAR